MHLPQCRRLRPVSVHVAASVGRRRCWSCRECVPAGTSTEIGVLAGDAIGYALEEAVPAPSCSGAKNGVET
jgi:hypothetical protein